MAKQVSVRLTRPGVKQCGEYKAGEVYQVDEKEAERLVRVKGFEVVSEADTKKAGE